MQRALLAGFLMFGLAGAVQAQAPAMTDAAKAMIGTWEFSNADRDKTCTIIFKSEPAGAGYKVEFDSQCADLFPLVRDVTAWKYPQGDLLYLIDAQGAALVSFSEVEDGMFEAPTPGVGVLFLQNPSTVPPPVKSPAQVAGEWTMRRGDGAPLCQLTFTPTPLKDGFALTVEPGCEAAIAGLGFVQWRLDREELLLVPARGAPWRFESLDDSTWGQLPETPDRITLVRK